MTSKGAEPEGETPDGLRPERWWFGHSGRCRVKMVSAHKLACWGLVVLRHIDERPNRTVNGLFR